MQRRFKCPRCGKMSEDYPALSRADNKTEICSACGTDEALFNMTYTLKEFLEHALFWQKDAGLNTAIVKKRLRGLSK